MFAAHPRARRGVVLIVVLGVLTVLALLATAFATLQGVERNVSRNYLDTVRARLLAMSGIEDAVDRLSSLAERGDFLDPSMQYWGRVELEVGQPDWMCPLEEALSPSFAHEEEAPQNPRDANIRAKQFRINGRRVGISGSMTAGTYAPHGDIYRLRVVDCNSLIHVNDGIENGREGYVSQNLKRILNNLGDLLRLPKIGDIIVDRRPVQGYVSRRDLEALIGREAYDRVRHFVTTYAWVDRNLANPVPLSTETLAAYPVKYNQSIGIQRYGRQFGTDHQRINLPLRFAPDYAEPTGVNHGVMAMDELNPQWIEVCGRAPVNVNLAPREVLTSLIVGLRGFFLVERRKHNIDRDMYAFLNHRTYENTPAGILGDEYGYLYSTVPFVRPGETTTEGGIDASKVADEIVACRGRQKSPNCPSIDYASVWYGGPFRNWRQFNAFCDGLAAGGFLKDDRPIYYDYDLTSNRGSPSGSDILVRAAHQNRFAGQALADVLKANFNPNLTLNESNPDANLHLLVDKTDLLANSTEFCFTPMGLFEIESEGVVVETPGHADFLRYPDGRAVARKKVSSAVKIYEVHRETSQAEFSKGSSRPPRGRLATDQNLQMVVGPEPDDDKLPEECRWSGWIQLSTYGGPFGHADAELGDVMHGHYHQNFVVHHHARRETGVQRPRTGDYRNNADRTETIISPYQPLLGPDKGRFRQARHWVQQLQPGSATTSAPGPGGPYEYIAPSDLRIDGAYIERDCALMYDNSRDIFDLTGTVAYWIKPSFRPEMTGKPRTFMSMDFYFENRWQMINGHWFLPSHDNTWGAASSYETASPIYAGGPWRPCSMLAGYSTYGSYGGGMGSMTSSLNHASHADRDKTDIMRHHGWVHVGYYWSMGARAHDARLVVNGRVNPPSSFTEIRIHPRDENRIAHFAPAPLRFGEPSRTMAQGTYGRNWAADSTLDEIYLWKGEKIAEVQTLWSRGRYYVPRRSREASFTSRPLALDESITRELAAPSPLRAPGEPAAAPPAPAGRETRTRERLNVFVLAAAWTWYPESTDERKGLPRIWDYQTQDEARRGQEMDVEVELKLVVNDAESLPLKDDGGSATFGLRVRPYDKLQYRFTVRAPDARHDTILLATPVIDDVTLYYSTGRQFLLYEI